jgi:uncharacterized membrane protein YkgB
MLSVKIFAGELRRCHLIGAIQVMLSVRILAGLVENIAHLIGAIQVMLSVKIFAGELRWFQE